ncbi:MAG: formylglycine-generating enzyme family protein [Nitrospirae bacterium]|nr:formylglycine-generating enzyme family protein [Nitrospirota bacterium]
MKGRSNRPGAGRRAAACAAAVLLASALLKPVPARADLADEMAFVRGGELTPLYRPEKNRTTVRVDPFFIDRRPVTRAEFLRFITANPRWRRSSAPEVFRDANYLSDWRGDLLLPVDPEEPLGHGRPIVQVSWFAARAYCASRGERLPTTAEWEFVATTTPSGRRAADDPAQAGALEWYARPSEELLAPVANAEANAWGVSGLHTLWEWVEDFSSSLLRGDNRADSDNERNLYCGGGTEEALDRADYAAFMRYAFRSALHASYSTRNLGFRCARNGTKTGHSQ